MGLRAAHGNAARGGRLRVVEVSPVDELPAGVPAAASEQRAAVRRDAQGRLADRESARELGRRGGYAKAGKTALGSRLAIGPVDAGWAPYRRAAESFARELLRDLARLVGGGQVGPGPSSIALSAAWQTAASRRAFAEGRPVEGSRFADQARQSVIAARELAALDGQARRAAEQHDRMREALAPRPSAAMAVGEDDGEDGDEDGESDE
ncbi:MAG: hypothetical protein IPM35_10155 [Myxococcales bacterium]|nr:hypothetical protein [Myxococcales bacterium]